MAYSSFFSVINNGRGCCLSLRWSHDFLLDSELTLYRIALEISFIPGKQPAPYHHVSSGGHSLYCLVSGSRSVCVSIQLYVTAIEISTHRDIRIGHKITLKVVR